MVKIAVVGGSGHLGREITDILTATTKHEITILSRKDATETIPGVTWVKVDYTNKASLTNILTGVNTVLSFVVAHEDPGSAAQKAVIDASIAAGVKRFVPSEWAASKFDELPWYGGKLEVRKYLEEINKDKKVIEYTLIQPGFIVDYLAPAGTNKHLQTFDLWIDFPNRRAIFLDGKPGYFTLTTVKDLTNIVSRAIEYDGEWPINGGVQGRNLTEAEFLEIATRVRGGKPFDVTFLKEEDVRAGVIKSEWYPKVKGYGFAPEQIEPFSKVLLAGSLFGGADGSWTASDDWNRVFPDYKFDDPEQYLEKAWAGHA